MSYNYQDLLNIIEQLRGENGCPWDKEQTHKSLMPHLLEESYELIEAIKNEDSENMKEELGDVLLQVLLHSQIAKEKKHFTIEDVINVLATKLVYRHPHVFGEKQGINTSEEVKEKWEKLKRKEKNEHTIMQSIDRVAKALPALIRTQKVQQKVIKSGNGLQYCDEIINNIIKQFEEIKKCNLNGNLSRIDDKIGDLLFNIVTLTTFFNLNPEFALTKSLEKFINRFRYIEKSTFVQEKQPLQLPPEKLDELWEMHEISQ